MFKVNEDFDKILYTMRTEYKPTDFGINKEEWYDVQMWEVENAWDDIVDILDIDES